MSAFNFLPFVQTACLNFTSYEKTAQSILISLATPTTKVYNGRDRLILYGIEAL